MNRFLNRLPTITIREGHRVKVYLTSDLELPAWAPASTPGSIETEVAMMSTIVLIGVVVVGLAAAPAHAQLAVIDPANLVQAVLIAQRAQRHYEELQAQYRTILRMAKGSATWSGYRIPAHRGHASRRRRAGSTGGPGCRASTAAIAAGAAYWATTRSAASARRAAGRS